MPPVPEIAHVGGQEGGAEVARRLNAEAVAGAHGHERVAGEIEEQVEAVHVGIFHLGAELGPPGPIAQRCRCEVVVKHGAEHLLVHRAHEQQHDAASQQVGVLRGGVGAIRVLGKAPAAIDGARGERSEEHEEVEVVGEVHVLDEVITNLDDDLHSLESDIGYAEKAHEVMVEHGTDLVDHQRGNDRNEGAAELPQSLLPALPAGKFPERDNAGNGEERREGEHALRVPSEQEQQECEGCCQAVVLDAMARKAEHRRRHDGHGEKDIESRVDIEVHGVRPPYASALRSILPLTFRANSSW